MAERKTPAADVDEENRPMTESRVARTPSVEEALRRLTNHVDEPDAAAAEDAETAAASAETPSVPEQPADAGASEAKAEQPVMTEKRTDTRAATHPRVQFDPRGAFDDDAGDDDLDDAMDFGDEDAFASLDDRGDLNVPTSRHVKRHMGGHVLVDQETEAPPMPEQFGAEPMFSPVVDVDVLLAALHGGDDEPLRRLSALAIASEREAILSSAKAEAHMLVSEARSHRRSILARAESKSEIMIARAEAQAAATVARAEARAQLIELESRNERIVISNRKKRKTR
jgi:hypothetical protein